MNPLDGMIIAKFGVNVVKRKKLDPGLIGSELLRITAVKKGEYT